MLSDAWASLHFISDNILEYTGAEKPQSQGINGPNGLSLSTLADRVSAVVVGSDDVEAERSLAPVAECIG